MDDVDDILELDIDEKFEKDKLNFYFVVDQSGSMGYPQSKMKTTIQALELFLQSLPQNSKFQIISFGSRHEWMHKFPKLIDYTDLELKIALARVSRFKEDFGGTNIFDPLEDIFGVCDRK